MPREDTFSIAMMCIDVTSTTHTSLDVLLEKILKITGTCLEKKMCQMHGQDSQDLFFKRKGNLKDIHGPGGDLQGNKKTSRPDDVWPDMWKFMSNAAKKNAKQRWAIEKPKLDNAKQLTGIFFIEPNDEEFKLTMKAALRKV